MFTCVFKFFFLHFQTDDETESGLHGVPDKISMEEKMK